LQRPPGKGLVLVVVVEAVVVVTARLVVVVVTARLVVVVVGRLVVVVVDALVVVVEDGFVVVVDDGFVVVVDGGLVVVVAGLVVVVVGRLVVVEGLVVVVEDLVVVVVDRCVSTTSWGRRPLLPWREVNSASSLERDTTTKARRPLSSTAEVTSYSAQSRKLTALRASTTRPSAGRFDHVMPPSSQSGEVTLTSGPLTALSLTKSRRVARSTDPCREGTSKRRYASMSGEVSTSSSVLLPKFLLGSDWSTVASALTARVSVSVARAGVYASNDSSTRTARTRAQQRSQRTTPPPELPKGCRPL
jgi:hypothetical protein